MCVGSEGGGGVLCERALLVWARPNIYLDLVYIYIVVAELGAISRRLALVRTGSIILRKNLFIYLFILVAFCLPVWVLEVALF